MRSATNLSARMILSIVQVMLFILPLFVQGLEESTADDLQQHGSLRRQLPGGAEYFKGGAAAIPLVGVIALILLCCCLCGGGRWSLCDLLACVCIYELCCDDGNPFGGFNLM